jgi:hypothetical protein
MRIEARHTSMSNMYDRVKAALFIYISSAASFPHWIEKIIQDYFWQSAARHGA